MIGRCNETLLKKGFDLDLVQPVDADVGTLYDGACCELCDARLFKGEVVKSKSQPSKKCGRSCCSDGAVELPRVKKLPRLDALWRDRTATRRRSSCASTRGSSTTRSHSRTRRCSSRTSPTGSRQDLAAPWITTDGCQFEGKMHHRIGPLAAAKDKAKALAQLYVVRARPSGCR